MQSLAADKRAVLEQTVRWSSERAERVARARVLLAPAYGASFDVAARAGGLRSTYGVALLARRFHQLGLEQTIPLRQRNLRWGPPGRLLPPHHQ